MKKRDIGVLVFLFAVYILCATLMIYEKIESDAPDMADEYSKLGYATTTDTLTYSTTNQIDWMKATEDRTIIFGIDDEERLTVTMEGYSGMDDAAAKFIEHIRTQKIICDCDKELRHDQ